MTNKFLLIILFTIIESILLLADIPICSDTDNYLSHPGVDTLLDINSSLPYYILHVIGDNKLWFKLIQFSSVIIFNSSILFLPLNGARLLLYLIAPFSFSIIGLHYWACSIRSGLSISFLVLYFVFVKSYIAPNNPYLKNQKLSSRIISYFFAFLTISSHWSSTFFLGIMFLARRVSFFTMITNFIHNFKFKKNHVFILVAFIVFVLMALFYSKTRLAAYSLQLNSPGYGNNFPFISIYSAITYFFIFNSECLSRNIRFTTNLFAILSVISFATIFSLITPLSIRIASPLQFFTVLSMIVCIPSFNKLSLYLLFISPPFIYYSLTSYFLSYS